MLKWVERLRLAVGAPYYPQTAAPSYPHRTGGVVLFVCGLLLFLVGVVTASYCFGSGFGCTSYPLVGVGALVALLGVVLFIVGIVMMVAPGEPTATAMRNVVYFHPPPHPPPPPGAVPGYAPPTGIVPAIAVERYCPACGAGNLRASAFCHRCGRPLPTGG
jgi:hypothetical protein